MKYYLQGQEVFKYRAKVGGHGTEGGGGGRAKRRTPIPDQSSSVERCFEGLTLFQSKVFYFSWSYNSVETGY